MPTTDTELRRWQRLERDYGLTQPDFEMLHDQQDGRCAICGSRPEGKPLCVDHCHSSNWIRGLLCNNCNRALGLFNDSPERLLAAVDYIVNSYRQRHHDELALERQIKYDDARRRASAYSPSARRKMQEAQACA